MSKSGPKIKDFSYYLCKFKQKYGDRFDYSQSNYQNCYTKIKIICKEHGEFFKSPTEHLSRDCNECVLDRRTKSNVDIEKEFIDKYGEKFQYNFSSYKRTRDKLIIICPIHGEFKQKPQEHLLFGCADCNRDVEKEIYFNEWKEVCNKKYDHKYDYSNVSFNNSHSIIIISCPEHGEFKTSMKRHRFENAACESCRREKNGWTTPGFIEKSNLIHNFKYDYSKTIYENFNKKVIIICKQHGDFYQKAGNHLIGSGCQICPSVHSKLEHSWLDSIGIPLDKRNINFKLKNNKLIKTDAFDQSTNTIYEFYGDYWHGNPKIFDEDKYNYTTKCTFGELYKRTLRREAMLKKHGFNLITIWENDFNKNRRVAK